MPIAINRNTGRQVNIDICNTCGSNCETDGSCHWCRIRNTRIKNEKKDLISRVFKGQPLTDQQKLSIIQSNI